MANPFFPSNSVDIPIYLSETTHPGALKHFQRHTEWEEFRSDLLRAVNGGLAKSPKYTNVYALLIQWENTDLDFITEVNSIESLFRDSYNYQTERFVIPKSGSQIAFLEQIIDFVCAHEKCAGDTSSEESKTKSDLLIIYYKGYSCYDQETNKCYWVPTKYDSASSRTRLNWSAIEGIFQESDQDNLLILDCCYAGTSAIEKIKGPTKELLAASGKEPQTSPGTESFTNRLVKALQDLPDPTISISLLYSNLLRDSNLKAVPIHVLLYQSHRTIFLSPIPQQAASSSSPYFPSLSLGNSVTSTIERRQSSVSVTDLERLDKRCEPRAVLVVRLSGNVELKDLRQEGWETWLRDDSPDVMAELSNIHLECILESDPTILMVSMPVHIWTLFPDDPAYMFVGFVR